MNFSEAFLHEDIQQGKLEKARNMLREGIPATTITKVMPILKNKFSFYHSNTHAPRFSIPPIIPMEGGHKSEQGFVFGDFVNIFTGIGMTGLSR